MDDEDFNLLGAAQRQQNLRQNEATRQEIAALRDDLRRKEAAEKAAPKCPYCAGVITDGVVKCRHCSSDIKWHEVDGKSYPMMAEEDPQHFVATKLPKLLEEERRRTIESPIGSPIESPMVGTFYRKPAPDADDFVQVGDWVSEGQTLCIIEAMKVMNEIKAEVSGTISEICVEDASPVQYGDTLFRVTGDTLFPVTRPTTATGSGCLITACTIPAGLLAFKAIEHFLT